MAIAAILCVFIGCYTPYLYNLLPYPVDYQPYTAYHVSETLQILLFTALGFFLFLDKLRPEAKISLDMDWFYRMGARAFLWLARRPVQAADDRVGEIYRFGGLIPLMATARFSAWFDWHAIDGVVDGFAHSVRRLGGEVRKLQTNQLQISILYAFLAVGVMVGWYILSN
jgi:multicomponent Na+:H+ antiporter subunit D